MDPLRSGRSVVGVGRGGAAEVAVFEAVAVAFEGDDLGVVDEPVDHGGGNDLVAEDLAPAAEGPVAGHDERGPLVAAAGVYQRSWTVTRCLRGSVHARAAAEVQSAVQG